MLKPGYFPEYLKNSFKEKKNLPQGSAIFSISFQILTISSEKFSLF